MEKMSKKEMEEKKLRILRKSKSIYLITNAPLYCEITLVPLLILIDRITPFSNIYKILSNGIIFLHWLDSSVGRSRSMATDYCISEES